MEIVKSKISRNLSWNSSAFCVFFCCVALTSLPVDPCGLVGRGAVIFAQTQDQEHHHNDRIGLSDTVVLATDQPSFQNYENQVWEFGLRITAKATLQGLTATAPIPLAFPEQEILQEITNKTPGVDRINITEPTAESRMVTFQIPRMSLGEVAEVSLRFEFQKRNIFPPSDIQRWKIPDRNDRQKRDLGRFLQPTPFIESRHRRIVEIVDELIDENLSAWEQVETNYRWVRENIQYEFDSEIRSCLEALDQGKGDCEEMSSIFIALCRAMQIPARAVLVPGHTYPEFYLMNSEGQGFWFPCQLAGSYQFGTMIESRPVVHKGDSFRVPGRRKPERYLKPTLIEKSGTGMVELELIMRPADTESASSSTQRGGS